MAHDKVYGICKSKCRVEVTPKCENKIMGANPIDIDTAQNGMRYIARQGDMRVINVYIPPDFDGYFEVVAIRDNRSTVKPSSYLKVTGCYVKFINDNNLDTSHDVLCYKFYNNGIHTVCECMSYVS